MVFYLDRVINHKKVCEISLNQKKEAYVSQLVLMEMGQGMLTPHFPGRLEARLGLTFFAAVFRHLHACWRSGVVLAILFNFETPAQHGAGTGPPFVRQLAHGAKLLVTVPHEIAASTDATMHTVKTRHVKKLRAEAIVFCFSLLSCDKKIRRLSWFYDSKLVL